MKNENLSFSFIVVFVTQIYIVLIIHNRLTSELKAGKLFASKECFSQKELMSFANTSPKRSTLTSEKSSILSRDDLLFGL